MVVALPEVVALCTDQAQGRRMVQFLLRRYQRQIEALRLCQSVQQVGFWEQAWAEMCEALQILFGRQRQSGVLVERQRVVQVRKNPQAVGGDYASKFAN